MIGAITPLVQAAGNGKWWTAVGMYAAGTLICGFPVGALLGTAGSIVGLVSFGVPVLLAACLLAGTAELLRLRIPRLPFRQTRKEWRASLGVMGSAFAWGADIGAGLTTRISFASVWVLVLAALFSGGPISGGVIWIAYGIGRIGLVVSGPLVAQRKNPALVVGHLIRHGDSWHTVHGVALILTGASLLWRSVN